MASKKQYVVIVDDWKCEGKVMTMQSWHDRSHDGKQRLSGTYEDRDAAEAALWEYLDSFVAVDASGW